MKLLVLGLALFRLTLTNQAVKPNFFTIAAEVNSQNNVSWTAGYNHYFDGMTYKEIKGLMGSLETPREKKIQEKEIIPMDDIPEKFDPREKWPKCESIKEIRDQSTCGSCWAFGAVETISDRICITSGQKLQVRISAQDLLACCVNCGSCDGGYPIAAWSYYKTNGIATGYLYNDTQWCSPYAFPPCDHHIEGKYGPCGKLQTTPKCERICKNGKKYESQIWAAQKVYGIPSNIQKIQTELMTNGPIQVSLTVYQDFLTYKSGVYHKVKGQAMGGHAVKMIGWGVENQTPYWLIANSWNEGWGDKGFFKIKRGNNECGIESQGVAGMVKIKDMGQGKGEMLRME